MPTDKFSTAGAFQWTPPAGVISVTIELWGGGGGGAGGTSTSAFGGGGGGGEYARWVGVAVTPLTAYNGTIGAAGTGTTGNGNNGGQTSVTIGANTYVADNGDGGKTAATAAAATGGVGGTITHTPAATQSVAGAQGATAGSTTGGGGGQTGGPGGAGTNPSGGTAGQGNTTTGVGGYSSSDGGAGSNNATGGAAPAASGTRTTGGGGGGAYRSSSSRSGGPGTAGWAAFTYTLPITLTVQNATHAVSSAAPVFTQSGPLTVQGTAHAQTVGTPTLSFLQTLVVANVVQAQTAGSTVLQQGVTQNLVVQNSTHIFGKTTYRVSLTSYTIPNSYGSGFLAGPDGNLWLGGRVSGTDNLWKINPADGSWVHVLYGGTGSITDMAVGADSNIWATDPFDQYGIWKIDPNTGIGTKYAGSISSEIVYICKGPDGNIWSCDDGSRRIYKFATDGTYSYYDLTTLASGTYFQGICVGSDGNLWLAANGGTKGVVKVPPSDPTNCTSYTLPYDVQGICSGPNGDLYLSIWSPCAIMQYRISDATYRTVTTGRSSGGQDIGVGPDGRIWMVTSIGMLYCVNVVPIETAIDLQSYNIGTSGTVRKPIIGPDNNLWISRAGANGFSKVNLDKVPAAPDLSVVLQATVANDTHGVTSGSPSITQVHNLVVASCIHSQTADAPVINVAPINLVVANAVQQQQSANIGLYGSGLLNVQSGSHTIISTNVINQLIHNIVVQNVVHATVAPNLVIQTFVPQVDLVVQNSVHKLGLEDFTSLTPILLAGSNPSTVCKGPDGNMWVTDSQGGVISVWKVSPDGSSKTRYTSTYALTPGDMCLGPDNNFWIAAGPSVVKMDTSGNFTKYDYSGVALSAICKGPDGNLWATDSNNGLRKIATDGSSTGYGGVGYPSHICVGPDGNIWCSSFSGISKVNPATGGVIAGYSGSAEALTSGPNNHIWAASSGDAGAGHIREVDPNNGSTIQTITVTGSSWMAPYVTVGPDGNLWTEDGNNVWRVTASGVITHWPKSSWGGGSIAWAADGSIFAVSPTAHNIDTAPPISAPIVLDQHTPQSLSVQNSAVGVVSQTIAVTQNHILVIQTSTHFQTAPNLSFVPQSNLSIQNVLHQISQPNVYISPSGYDANIWTGTAWKRVVVKVYRANSTWVIVPMKKWNGSAWVSV